MRHRTFATALLLLLAAPRARAERAIRPEDAPRANAAVLRALNRGDRSFDVIVGVRDGEPSAKALAAHPDPSGEPARRIRRLAAQRRLAETLPVSLEVRRHYENFSMLAGRATREGVLALANRRDVAWVMLDGVRRKQQSSFQATILLIHSDQANALGITGEGQTIAILDTGVDYTIPDLGGGAFPNAKVIGGTDIGDNDSDPMDCEGHGTSVAAVAAGPDGVAPFARIVALKISKTSNCGEALDSDILAAINWAVTNQATYGISAINLSFGGAFDDGGDHGYCDSSEPQYAGAIEAASAAGMVFVAAAGNEAFSNSVDVPACISSAVAVGAVYPSTSTREAWADDSGGTFCADEPATIDSVVCFSNSASSLSLLAPGADWAVATKGGRIELFAGTSAAAPAVTGAVALARQARPELGPAATVGLLRSTGQPIVDPRNGILTPRIDTLAAVELPVEAFASFDGTDVAIPDGSGSASATATVAGFTGTAASVQAVVEIAHEDPRQLIVTLTGPDGTSVLLHDRTGAQEHPINAIYGKTVAAAQSLAAFQGKPPNGVWRLTVQDTVPTSSGVIRNFAMRVVAGQPPGAIPSATETQVFPIVGRVQGSKFFLSDVRIFNPAAEPHTLSLFYVAQGLNGSQAVVATRTVAPSQVLALNDVVGSEFGYASSIGQLTLVAPGAGLIASSRAYTQSSNGTFGLFVPAFESTAGIGPGQRATANGLSKDPQFHTNAGFTEMSGAPVTVKMDIYGGDGTLRASTTRDAAANASILVTDIVSERGLGAMSNFRIDYSVVSGTGRVVPFATFIDGVTGDGVFEAGADPAPSTDDIIIAQASHATGANGDFFKTNLHITNLDAAPSSVTVSLIPRVLTGTPNPSRVYTIAPGQTLEALDVLAGEFALGDPSAAGLRIHPSGSTRLCVSSRTYVEKFGGTFGFSIPGIAASEALATGPGCVGAQCSPNPKAAVIQLDQTAAAQGYRSNFGFAEVGGADATVRVTFRSGDDPFSLGSSVFPISAGESFQANVGQILGGATVSNIYLEFEVESGAGRILPYGVSIDNTSGDAIYIPAQKEP